VYLCICVSAYLRICVSVYLRICVSILLPSYHENQKEPAEAA